MASLVHDEIAPPLRWRLRRGVEYAAVYTVEAMATLCAQFGARPYIYDGLVALSGVLHALTSPGYAWLRRNSPKRDYRALLLRDMLCAATPVRSFPIRTRLIGGEILERVHAEHGGMILCTAHFGLTLAMFSVLEARGIVPAGLGVVSDKSGRLHWGCTQPVQLIESDAMGLVRARAALKAGGALLVFPEISRSPPTQPDTGDQGLDVAPNVFRFARLVGAPMLFFSSALDADGAICLEVVEPSHSLPRDTEEVAALQAEFCGFLETRMGRPCTPAPLRQR